MSESPSAILAGLGRGWARVLTPKAWIALHDEPHPSVARVLRWSPILAPALFGGLMLTVTLALVAHMTSSPSGALAVPLVIALFPALFGVYLGGGASLGLALRFAPNGVVWLLALSLIPALTLTLMLSIAFGAPGMLSALAILFAALTLYTARQYRLTRVGTVDVTQLLGEWRRALRPGYNVLLPGERVIVTLDTAPHRFTTAQQRVALSGSRTAEARLTMTYAISAQDAWRTAQVRATWEDELRQRVVASLRASLNAWGAAGDISAPSPDILAQQALDATQAWVAEIGVVILSIRAHDIAVKASKATRGASQPLTPVSIPAGMPAPDVLERLYNAVRKRQINDTRRIREIAGHFATLARLPRSTEPGAVDATAAARLLTEYVAVLEVATRRPKRARRR